MVAAEVSYEPAGFGLCRWRGTCGELQEIGASAGTINRGGTGLIPIGDCGGVSRSLRLSRQSPVASRAKEVFMRHSGHRRQSSLRVELHARQMRSWLTPSEQALWELIRGRRLGVQFCRQVPVGRFIVDFLAPAQRLVVEVDGGYHARRVVADERRDRVLRRLGYRVLRLPAALVLSAPAEAFALVAALLE
jgi:very-short-patch-repair endonuclease